MGFLIKSSTGGSLPQDAMRSIVEAVDTWRGQAEAFVVFHDKSPYEIVSVHPTDAAAQTAVKARKGLNYFGPVAPRPRVPSFRPVPKPTGCPIGKPLPEAVSTVVLRNANDVEVAHFTVNVDGRLPNPESDIEALFLTVSGLDKFMIPYLARVFGAEYAAARRREWVKE
jgi:hypothetical protein